MGGSLYISHRSALEHWRTNPPWYVLEGRDRNIRSLRDCVRTTAGFRAVNVPESEFGEPPFDILIPASNPPRCPDRFRPHKQSCQLPRHALYPLWDGIHVVSPELCFVQMCNTLSFVEALELGMELCGTYALRPDYAEGKAQRDFALIDAATLSRRLQAWEGLKGLGLARRAAKYLAGGSASPMETKLYLLLCLPLQYGGYNLGRPLLNPELKLTPEEAKMLRVTKIKPDMLWEKQKLIIEFDGRQHEEEQQSKYDALRQTVLENRGYTVLRIMRHQMYNPIAFDGFASTARKFLGIRTRPVTAKHQLAREELRSKLLGG